MNQRIVVITLAVVSLGLGRCYSSPPGHVPDTGTGTGSGSAATSKPHHTVTSTVMLTQDLEACEAQLEAMGSGAGSASATPPVRVKVKVVHDGDPRKCTSGPPPIEAVDTSECQEGMLCLDAKAQRALAHNLAAYEAWVAKVTACEK